jgi:HTH-type transcriptional regulator/antitoxin HipB
MLYTIIKSIKKMENQEFNPFNIDLTSKTIVEPLMNSKGKSLSQFKDETLGKIGTKNRDAFELELKMEIIQDLIRETRKKRNLSQQQLGDLIGVNKAQISKIEKGYSNTTISMISKVFSALNAKVRITIELDQEEFEII